VSSILLTQGSSSVAQALLAYLCRTRPLERLLIADAAAQDAPDLSQGPSGIVIELTTLSSADALAAQLCDHRIDTIINLTPEALHRRALSAQEAVRQHVDVTALLLDAARLAWSSAAEGQLKRFHQASHVIVFGPRGSVGGLLDEASGTAPASASAAALAAADQLVFGFAGQHRLTATVSYAASLYGAQQSEDALVPRTALAMLEGRKSPIYGDGLDVADWLTLDDHVRGLCAILEKGRAGRGYGLASGQPTSVLELTMAIASSLDRAFASRPELAQRFPRAPMAQGRSAASLLTFVRDRRTEPPLPIGRWLQTEADIGFRPRDTLSSGIARCVDQLIERFSLRDPDALPLIA
jgi:dTDP-glucose 4,6-dehydratase